MKAKIFTVFVLLAILAVTLSGPAMAQGPGTPEPPLARRVEERLGIAPSGVEGVIAAQQAQNVELVSQIGGCVYAVTLQGNYAYVAAGESGLRIINVADPRTPARPVSATRRGGPWAWRWQATTPTSPLGTVGWSSCASSHTASTSPWSCATTGSPGIPATHQEPPPR